MLAHWEDPGDPWDRLVLGTHEMPGIWEITGEGCRRQVDHKKTKKKDGARIEDLGVLPARFVARGQMTSIEDWESLQTIMPDLNPKKKGGLKFPLKIFHPAVAVLGITTIYVEHVSPPEIKNGVLEIQLDMIEWSDPKDTKTSAKPAGNGAYLTVEEAEQMVMTNRNIWGLRVAGGSGEIASDNLDAGLAKLPGLKPQNVEPRQVGGAPPDAGSFDPSDDFGGGGGA